MDESQRTTVSSAEQVENGTRAGTVGIAFRKPSMRIISAVVVVGALVLMATWTYLIVTAINGARSDISTLRSFRTQQIATISTENLAQAATSFSSLQRNVREIDRLTSLPPGVKQLVEHLPWIGKRYNASRTMLRLGLHLADAGQIGSTLALQTLRAYESAGVTVPASSGRATWLDVLSRNTSSIDRIQRDLDLAEQERGSIDSTVLPQSIQRQLPDVDRLLDRYRTEGQTARSDLNAAIAGLGSDKTMRYLVLFQNPAELRPSGGFPGTMALITVSRGQLVSYRIFDGHTLTDAYIEQRTSKRPEPWPIDYFFPQDGFLLHDAGWYADFPKAGSTIMSMYAETDWPPIDGVIAIQPTVVADLLQVTGPLDVKIDGELRHVTADNVYDEIERQRRLIVEGIKPWDQSRETHKEAVASIGEAIIAHLKTADRSKLAGAIKLLMNSANVRDIQAYAADPALESAIDRQGWSGRLDPSTSTPSVAIIFANVALQKSSEFMHPSLRFTVSPSTNGQRIVTLDIAVDNTGPLGEDPFYSGFQNWWIEVSLPHDFQRVSSSLPREPDPESPNGGSYLIGINPQQSGQVTVVFTMPADVRFLLRRQPGLTVANVTVAEPSCGASNVFKLTSDQTVDIASLCQS